MKLFETRPMRGFRISIIIFVKGSSFNKGRKLPFMFEYNGILVAPERGAAPGPGCG